MRIRQDLGPPNIIEVKSRSDTDNREITVDNDILVVVQDSISQETLQGNTIEEVIIQDFLIESNVIEKFIVEEDIIQLKDAGPVFAGPEGPTGPDLFHAWLNDGNVGSFNDFLNVVRQGLVSTGNGGISSQFIHNQYVPSDIWNVNHNLHKRPSVVCIDSAGETFEPDYEYIDENNIKITIISPIAGKAYLN